MPQHNIYQVGIATVDITPPVGIHLAGFAARKAPADGVYHPLRGTATAISDDHASVLFVVVEWLGLYELTEPLREKIVSRVPIDPAHIVLSGTHTHCGPAVRQLDLARHGALDDDYVQTSLNRLADCAAKAWTSRTPATLRVGVANCDVACSRRRPNAAGGVDWAPALDEPTDHELTAIAIESPAGAMRGVLFNYACHPTSNAVTQIGGDYVGFAVEAIERQYPGAVACFFQGCAGDQKVNAPKPGGDGFRQLSIDEVKQVGQRVAHATVAAIEQASAKLAGPIAMTQQRIQLETEPATEAGIAKAKAGLPHQVRWADYFEDIVTTGKPQPIHVPFEIQTITFGRSFAFVGFSAEMVAEYALRLKPLLREQFQQCIVAGYCNHIIGYVSSARQYPRGGYEVRDSSFWYLRTGPYLQSTEDQLVNATMTTQQTTVNGADA